MVFYSCLGWLLSFSRITFIMAFHRNKINNDIWTEKISMYHHLFFFEDWEMSMLSTKKTQKQSLKGGKWVNYVVLYNFYPPSTMLKGDIETVNHSLWVFTLQLLIFCTLTFHIYCIIMCYWYTCNEINLHVLMGDIDCSRGLVCDFE